MQTHLHSKLRVIWIYLEGYQNAIIIIQLTDKNNAKFDILKR